MKINLKQTLLLCGLALMLAAFPVSGQDIFDPPVKDTQLNRKPLDDLGNYLSQQVEKKEFDFSGNFLIEVESELTKDGKFDVEKTKYVRTEGDEKMVDVAKRGIEAVNDSGYFQYLSQLGAKKINLIFSQNNEQTYAILKTDLESEKRARSFQSTLALMLNLVKVQKMKETLSENDKDDLALINGTTISSEDKAISIKIVVEKSIAQEMIGRKLKKEMDKRNKEKVN